MALAGGVMGWGERLRRRAGGVALALLLAAVAIAPSSPAQARPLTAGERALQPWRAKVEGRLAQLHDAWRADGRRGARRFAARHALALEGDDCRVRVEVRFGRASAGSGGAAVDLGWLRQVGAELRVAGSDRADAALPLAQLAALAERPEVAWLQLPLAPRAFAVQSQGLALAGLMPYHCQNLRGQGATVAVVDLGFAGWGAAAAAGELPSDVATPADGGYPHGTQCAEIIADLAPGAAIVPVEVHSVAALQAWLGKALAGPAPLVVSHSMGWFGETFGDGSGWLCQAAAQLRAQGGVWVTAAGNLGSGSLWRGPWLDQDGDGWLEFAAGDSLNRFEGAAGSQVLAVLDWDAYPASDIDLDLQLCRVVDQGCQEVAVSASPQSGAQPPVESLSAALSAGGLYAWRVRHHPGPLPKELRLSVVSPAQGPLQHFSTAKTLAHPGDCAAAVTVAALPVVDYATGPVAAYSSRGPTSDGRAKPDLAGPAAVATSQAAVFHGTSAACPHVAAAIAVQAQVAGVALAAAASAVVAAAEPLPGAAPQDLASGHGKLHLALAASGAACEPGLAEACTTSCGGSGVRSCSATCQLSACQAPAESCNGADDDCDGATDDGFACSGAAVLACDSACGSKGTRSCDASCAWGPCKAPAEVCNGLDDDCDGASDEAFACRRGDVVACTTAEGRSGSADCGDDCQPLACVADEVCNGRDDDGDGRTDELSSCPPLDRGWCQAGRSAPRGVGGVAWALLGALAVLGLRRRGAGAPRQAFSAR